MRVRLPVLWTAVVALLWTFFGAGLLPRAALAHASAHAACLCMMCKSGKKCCCTPETTLLLSASCDATQSQASSPALPPVIAPELPLALLPLPSAALTPVYPAQFSLPLCSHTECESPPPQDLSL